MVKKKIILANWKSNKSIKEAEEWTQRISNNLLRKAPSEHKYQISNKIKIILCSPFISLSFLKVLILKHNLPILLGAQDISPFEEGPYTGEVSARMLKDLVDYVIIGHSERRRYFGETNEMVAQKVKMAVKYGLVPIVCISNLKQVNYLATSYQLQATSYILYEPLFAIGSGQPDTPENADKMAREIKKILGKDARILYGGSVTQKNVVSFLSQSEISGVGVGGASLEAKEFLKIIENASKI